MQESDASVAALIATMDRPDHVRKAIESVCQQTYDAIEIVVVDASSDDRTNDVVEELRRSYPDRPFEYVHNDTPRGLPAARNQAVAETDAEYLAFLDDDDRWWPEKTARQLSAFESGTDRLGLVHAGYRAVDGDGGRLFTFVPEYGDTVDPELLVRNTIRTPSSVMVRRDAVEDVGGFDEQLRFCADWDFYLRVSRNYDVDYVAEPMLDRMYHDDAMIEDLESLFTYREALLEKHADTLDAHGVTDRAWATHYRGAGERYLEAGNRSAARAAYYALLTRQRDPRAAVVYLLLWLLPTDYVTPTIDALTAVERRIQPAAPTG